MKWSSQQVVAIDKVKQWLRGKDQPCFRLFGYAGVGKTTLARHLAEGEGSVYFVAYTGKAASVMRAKGCGQAMTIHQLIYMPTDKSKAKLNDLRDSLMHLVHELEQEGDPPEAIERHKDVVKFKRAIAEEEKRLRSPAFTLNPDAPIQEADLVVVDECSMVNNRMGEDLLSFNIPILVLGDPAQLPPVKGGGFFTNKNPDVMLTEIHRQARDNPIIDLATRVREGQSLVDGRYGDSIVMTGKPEPSSVTEADQILVGANLTRRMCNDRMRGLLGFKPDPMPEPGDKVVCLRNDHDVGLLNGTLWEVTDVQVIDGYNRIGLSIKSNGDTLEGIEAHVHYFQGRESELPYYEIRDAQCFDFGYALTTHKAQGSQWPNVFIFDESCLFRNDAKRWLYTAITRASERVTVCRK